MTTCPPWKRGGRFWLLLDDVTLSHNAILDLADFREVVTMPHNDARVSVVFREVVTMTDDATL